MMPWRMPTFKSAITPNHFQFTRSTIRDWLGLRKFLIQRFDVLIFFRIDADMIEIIRVLHGARDIPSLFVGDPVEGGDPSTP